MPGGWAGVRRTRRAGPACPLKGPPWVPQYLPIQGDAPTEFPHIGRHCDRPAQVGIRSSGRAAPGIAGGAAPVELRTPAPPSDSSRTREPSWIRAIERHRRRDMPSGTVLPEQHRHHNRSARDRTPGARRSALLDTPLHGINKRRSFRHQSYAGESLAFPPSDQR